MKLSTKLLIGLLGTMLVMMLISAFSIKSEFEKINQKDLFWNSIKISNKPFKHLKVIGQKDAEGTVNILNGKFFGNSKKFGLCDEFSGLPIEQLKLAILNFGNLSFQRKPFGWL